MTSSPWEVNSPFKSSRNHQSSLLVGAGEFGSKPVNLGAALVLPEFNPLAGIAGAAARERPQQQHMLIAHGKINARGLGVVQKDRGYRFLDRFTTGIADSL